MDHLLSIRVWLYSLMATVVSSAAGATALVVVDPKTFNLEEGFPRLLKVAGVLAIVALFNYLQTHPLPAWDPGRDVDRRRPEEPSGV